MYTSKDTILRSKIRDEMRTVVAPLDVMTEELWIEKLSFAKVSSMTYTSNVLNETLRIDPPF